MMLTVCFGPPVIGEDKFSDPEVARADHPPHCEAFQGRLRGAGGD